MLAIPRPTDNLRECNGPLTLFNYHSVKSSLNHVIKNSKNLIICNMCKME